MGNKYRKKPVVIEAVQVTPEMIRDFGPFPNWSLPHLSAEKTEKINGSEAVFVRTLEGDMRVSPNDWLIRGVKGEVHPCKPDIFAATYEDANPVAAGETNHPAIPDSSRPVAAVVAVPVWVSADTPPTNERTVIVRCSTGQMYMDRYDLVRGWDVSPYVMAGSVTHWQPLPAPPQAPEGT